MSNSRQILIVGPSWVGDMIMAQTLFKLIKQQQPETQIDVITPNSTRALLTRMPEIRQALALPLGHGQLQLRQRYRIGRQLRLTHYDQAIVLTNSWKSALIPFWANIPLRTGWRGEWRWGLLNDIRQLDKQRLPLMIERFAALGLPAHATLPTALPWPQLQVHPNDVDAALTKQQLQRPTQPVLALCPGAEYGPAKRWPTDHFAAVAQQKISEGWQVWLLGGPNDQALAAAIQTATQQRCINLVGKTSLPEAIDLLSLATTVVSNDSGLMHIAAALQRPLIVIYGSSDPRFTPPLTHQAKILTLNLPCSPCFKRTCPLQHTNCLQQLTPQLVLSALSS